MLMKIQSVFLYLLILLLGYAIFIIPMGCANPSTRLTGGPKDEQPPRIDSLKSTPNPSINFDQKLIELTFDEWIKLEDAFNQVVVSPPLNQRLDVKLKGKTVRIEIDEKDTLRENTTYIINFGNAVKDLTENNIPPNLKFVFSTGNEIDSLEASGKIFDVTSGKGEPDVLVMLYENLADTVVRTEKPYYFAKTDKSGNFNLEYLKPGTYKAFALVDNNFNYLFDLPNEKIGFLDEPIIVTDTSITDFTMKIFEEEPPLLITDQELRSQGVIKLLFNKSPKEVELDYSDAFQENIYQDIVDDTLIIWYTELDSSLQREIRVALPRDEFYDTIQFEIPTKKRKSVTLNTLKPLKEQDLSIKDSFDIKFNLPIAEWDTSLIQVTRDSLPYSGKLEIRIPENPRDLQLHFDNEEDKKYEFTLLPGAIKDIFGNTNDTLIQKIHVLPMDEFGDLNLTVVFPDSSINYIVELITRNNESLFEFKASQQSSIQQTFKTLPSGTYKIKVIEDANGNGRRDSGNYDEKRQPERIFEKTLDELRKNWELELEVTVVF